MLRLSFVLPLLLCAVAPLAAQTPDEPNLTLTLFGGVVQGHALWRIDQQPLCVWQGSSTFTCGAESDTLRLTREIGSSIIAGASASYFRSSHLGFQAELYYLGLPFSDSCSPVVPYKADTETKNQQLCDNISGSAPSVGAIALYGSVIVRASAMHAVSPYVRIGGGVVAYPGGTVEMFGSFIRSGQLVQQTRTIIADDRPKGTTVSMQVGTGFTFHMGSGYQFRFELRDAIVPLQRVAGPADSNGQGATKTTRTYSHFALTLGLDVVLERKRGRRY